MKVNVILVFVVLALGLIDAARRRDRLKTTTMASLVDRQFAFDGQPEELENLWNNFDSHKLNVRAGIWKNDTENRIILGSARQYPGLPNNPGDANELPKPISPPVQPAPPPFKPPPGCLGPRGQYSSPKSCANYLNCWDDVVVEQTCPTGLLFNDVAGYCDFAFNVNCGDRQPPTPKPSLPAGSQLCPDPNGRYRSSTNCSEFYVCAAGKPVKFYCPLGLVYSDTLNVCDYQYNVDCKGTATPKPLKPTQPPTQSPQPSSTYAPIKPSTASPKPPNPPQPPIYQPQQPPTYPSQQSPTYQPQPPTYQPQPPPTYPPQPSTNPPKPPSYQPYPPPPPYGNPWLNQLKSDSWHQRNLATQLEFDKEIQKQEVSTGSPASGDQPAHDAIETSSLTSPWTLLQTNLPSELKTTPCDDGDVYKLNDFCTKVVVCRHSHPEVVECPPGLSYDKPSDSCIPFNIATCELSGTPPALQ